jgi:hypothetical protein
MIMATKSDYLRESDDPVVTGAGHLDNGPIEPTGILDTKAFGSVKKAAYKGLKRAIYKGIETLVTASVIMNGFAIEDAIKSHCVDGEPMKSISQRYSVKPGDPPMRELFWVLAYPTKYVVDRLADNSE